AGLMLLEFVTGPSRENDRVAFLDLERPARAILDHLPRPDREDFAFLRFALGIVRKTDSAGCLLIRLEPPNDDSIRQWLHLHGVLLLVRICVEGNTATV